MTKKTCSLISVALAVAALMFLLFLPAIGVDEIFYTNKEVIQANQYSYTGIEAIKGIGGLNSVLSLQVAIGFVLFGIAFILVNAFTKQKDFGVLAIAMFAVTVILYFCTKRMFISANKTAFGKVTMNIKGLKSRCEYAFGVGPLLAGLLMIASFVFSVLGTLKNKEENGEKQAADIKLDVLLKKIFSVGATVIAVVALVLFFFMPAISVDAGGVKYSHTGMDVVKGLGAFKVAPGVILTVILAVFGIGFMLVNAFTKQRDFGGLAIILFAITMVLYRYTKRMFMNTNKAVFGEVIPFKLGVGAVLAAGLMLFAFILSLVGVVKNKKVVALEDDANTKSAALLQKIFSLGAAAIAIVALVVFFVKPAVEIAPVKMTGYKDGLSLSGGQVIKGGVNGIKGAPDVAIVVVCAIIGIVFMILNAFTKQKAFGFFGCILFAFAALLYFLTMRIFMRDTGIYSTFGSADPLSRGLGSIWACVLSIVAVVWSIVGTIKNKGRFF